MRFARKHDSLTATGTAAMTMLRQASLTGIAVATISSPTLAFATPSTATNTTNFTDSTAEIDTTVDTAVTNQVNTYSTELIARLQGGPTLIDETFNVSAADATFLAAVTAVEALLTGDGATSFAGPTLLSSNDALSVATSTIQTGSDLANVDVNTEQFVGPITINVNDFGICTSSSLDALGHPVLSGCSLAGSPFTLTPGQTDFDTFILSSFNIFTTTTTTNTDFLTQVYELDGVVPTQTATVPEPATLGLFGFGLAGVYLGRRKRKSC